MRWNDQQDFDEQKIAAAIEQGSSGTPVVQFSAPAAYDGSVLERIDYLCGRFGAKVHVRFYGHYGGEFDCRSLRRIPQVRSLGIDCLMHAANVEELNELRQLEELTFGVFEADVPRLLETPSLAGLRKLILVNNRKSDIDLAPLAAFCRLEDLTLGGHSRHIDVLARLHQVRKLGLNQIRKNVRLEFIRSMPSLESLSIVLGGRTTLDEASHEQLTQLHVLRVRGLEGIDLARFPSLTTLHIEDQLRLEALNLEPVGGTLRRLKIFNCKHFRTLSGMQSLSRLEHLWLARTAIDAEDLLPRLPKTLQQVSLLGFGAKRNAVLKGRLRSMGYAEAAYLESA